MNAKLMFLSLLAFGLTGAALAEAGPVIGTAKARGDYSSSFGQSRGYSSRAQSGYRYSAPIVRTAPPAQYRPANPPVVVAEAPVEARRFSYQPAPAATAAPSSSSPCDAATTVAPETGRRYSYEPAPSAQPAPSYQPSSGHSGVNRSQSGGGRELWALPKTDPRKYSSR
jgi:hypothetical protein